MKEKQTRWSLHKVLSLVLALVMVLGMVPTSVFAVGEDEQAAAASSDDFLRIVHLDCGRKYFSVDDLKKVIDYAADSNYTHVELAFGNDGLRFLLDDMSLTVNGTAYDSNKVTSAIQAGNKAFYDAGEHNELTQSDMDTLIAYAKSKKIGIIPMFDAPGHLQVVIRAMKELGLKPTYSTPTTSGTSVNWAINPTDTASLAFVKALVEKYMNYFSGKASSKYFNIAADECGFSGMSTTEYTAYASFVNSLAKMAKTQYGLTAMAFNDGIYYQDLTTNVEFDTDIVVCYWDATANKYAPAATLAAKGFNIINTHNKWYYVLGAEGNGWYGAEWSKSNMQGAYQKCDVTDGDYQTTYGCMNAIWCDTPSATVRWSNVETHIKTLAAVSYNKTFFKQVTTEPVGPDPVEPPEKTEDQTATNADLGASVTVSVKPGQTLTLDVSVAENPQAKFDDGVKVVSYDVTPYVDGERHTGKGTVTMTVPTDWADKADRVGAYIITDGATEVLPVSVKDGKATFAVPHFSEMGLYLAAQSGSDTPEQRTITVSVGGTATDTIKDAYYPDAVETEDEATASVSVKAENTPEKTTATKVTNITSGQEYYISDGDGNYLTLDGTSLTNETDVNKATKWTITKSWNNHYISSGNYYLRYQSGRLGTAQSTNTDGTSWRYDGTAFYYNYYNYRYYYIHSNGSKWELNTSSKNGAAYTVTTTPAVKQTTVTFTGNKVGTTYATIGNVRYTINVEAEDLSKVPALPITLWFTNCDIEVDLTQYDGGRTTGNFVSGSWQDNKRPYYVNVSANDAYGEKGVALSKVLPEEVLRYENSNTYWIQAYTGKVQKKLVLWSGRVHTSDNLQLISGTDYSNTGTEFHYVRYYNGKWAVSSDGVDWRTTVTGAGSTGSSSTCTEQLAVYYMMRSEITQEVTTDVADWGYVRTDDGYSKQVNNGQYVILDFAVKYENGTRNPSTFPQDGKTFVFHCTPNDGSGSVKRDSNSNYYRQLNNFRGINTSDYEIYMVTVTMTENNADDKLTSTTEYSYNGEEQIVWAIDEKTKTNSGLNDYTSISGSSSVYSGCKIGGDPYIRGVEIYNEHGALITYYIRAIEKKDSLHVYYVNQATNDVFHSYIINVNSKYSDRLTFDPNIGSDSATWNSDLDHGTVVNDFNQTIQVSGDLKTMPSISAQYRYSKFNCVNVTHSDDLKNVYLYYVFDADKTFVVDFGLPLKIRPVDVSASLSTANIERVEVKDSAYATITTNSDFIIDYKLTKIMKGEETIVVRYVGTNPTTGKADYATFNVRIIPASTVYYEDSFVKFESGSINGKNVGWETETKGNVKSVSQALEELGGKNNNVYGYDKAYKDSNQFSMGSAQKVTVAANMVTDWQDTYSWPTASFTFKGTGFDIISLTDNNSGAIFVDVYKGAEAKGDAFKSLMVNNYYGYKQVTENGKTVWVVDENASDALYQIPVMKVSGMDYGEYTVVIRVAYSSFFDKTNDNQYTFWLDAIRIYDPMGTNVPDYAKDGEGYPQYIKLRDEITGAENGKGLFIDGAENATIDDYKNYGPNNEVYLAPGQAISFKISADQEIDSIQIGAKSPKGGAVMSVDDDKTGTDIQTATEMYYKISTGNTADRTFVITNKSTAKGSILSLTNVKITYKNKPTATTTLAELTEEDQADAVNTVRALFAVPVVEPDPFQPSRLEARWTKNVRAGQKATLTVKTSTDVESITVNGVAVTSYRTRTERKGWGWNAPKVTYREFTYTVTAQTSGAYEICAVNAEGTASEPITATLTVRSGRWWNIFAKWF